MKCCSRWRGSCRLQHSAVIIYIHGFNSSARSFKAGLLQERLSALGRADEYVCPDLAYRPLEAIAQLEALVTRHTARPVTLIGSSLGGYYATWLAEKFGVNAVLVNPAVRPYELLRDYIGRQKNLYTGAEYEFTQGHLDELRSLETEAIAPQRYLLLVQTGDEVLDYRQAVQKYSGARQMVIEGGDHGFSDFARYLDTVLEFCGTPSDSCHAHS